MQASSLYSSLDTVWPQPADPSILPSVPLKAASLSQVAARTLDESQGTKKSGKSLAAKIWTVVAYPFCQLIKAIVRLARYIFPCLRTKAKPADDSKAQSVAKKTAASQEPEKKSASASGESGSSAGTSAVLCPRTLHELFVDIDREAYNLQCAVQALDFGKLRAVMSERAETQIEALKSVAALHYEINETHAMLAEMIKNLEAEGGQDERIKRLALINANLEQAFLQFKGKVESSVDAITHLFYNVYYNMNEERLSKSSLWALRNYLFVLRFMYLNQKQVANAATDKCQSLMLDALQLASDNRRRMPLSRSSLKSAIDQVNKHITFKELQLKEKQKDISKEALQTIGAIPNLGNSCYLNSSLQAVLGSLLNKLIDAALPEPREPVKGLLESSSAFAKRYQKYQQEHSDWNAKIGVQQALQSFKAVYELDDVKLRSKYIGAAAKNLRKAIFESNLVPSFLMDDLYEQQDAPELMGGLLQAIGHSFKLKITTESLEGDNDKSAETESLSLLQIPMPIPDPSLKTKADPLTFQGLIDSYKNEEVNDSDNKWEGAKGKHTHYRRVHQISGELPDVMAIQLNRMYYNQALKKRVKIDTEVNWGSDIVDLKELIDPRLIKHGESTKYRLVSYVNHHGSAGGGHYTANVNKAGQWLRCDDNSPIEMLGSGSETYARQHAYVVVLERVLD